MRLNQVYVQKILIRMRRGEECAQNFPRTVVGPSVFRPQQIGPPPKYCILIEDIRIKTLYSMYVHSLGIQYTLAETNYIQKPYHKCYE